MITSFKTGGASFTVGDRVSIKDDAYSDAPRLMKYRGQTGKVVNCWPSYIDNAGLVLIRLDNGTSLYAFGSEVSPLQLPVGG